MKRVYRLDWLRRYACATATFAIASCGGNTSSPPSTDPRVCNVGGNSVWQQVGLQGVRTEPRGCPYVVKYAGDSAPFSVTVTGPGTYGGISGSGVKGVVTIHNIRGQSAANVPDAFMGPDSHSLNGGILIQWNSKFAAGTRSADGTKPAFDTATITMYSLYSLTNSVAWLYLPGHTDSTLGKSIVGQASVAAGTSSSWSVSTPRDTVSYQYVWRVDGVTQTGSIGNGFSASLQNVGTHSISAIVYRSDFSADTIAKSVSVTLTSAVSGPLSVGRYCTYTYTATRVGGVAPFVKVWKLNGSVVGANADSYDLLVDWLGARSLSVQTTDAVGNVSNASMSVTGVSAGQCYQ